MLIHNYNMFNSGWYNSLTKPFLSPPNYVFSPVWAVLYVLIFISLILFIASNKKDKTYGYIFFIIQLGLNLAWTPVFFLLHNIPLALTVILLLDVFVLLTIKEFYATSKISGMLLIPYLVWILFATYLNIGYFVLN